MKTAVMVILIAVCFLVAPNRSYATGDQNCLRKASRGSTETRKPGERSFTSEIENGFWVVLPFLAFLSLMLSFGLPPLVWAGTVSVGAKWMLFRVALLTLIFLYWLWRRRTMPWRRVLGYAAVFAAFFTDLLGGVAPVNTFLVQLPSRLNPDPTSIISLIYSNVLGWFIMMGGASVLTTLYGVLIERREL